MFLRIVFSGFMFFMLSIILPGLSYAVERPKDAGLVTRVEGDAVYWNDTESGEEKVMKSFMKIRPGDKLKLTAGTNIELLFFSTRSKETWQGPVLLDIEIDGSRPEGTKNNQKPVRSETLMADVVEAIEDTPLPMSRGRTGRSGVIILRGIDNIDMETAQKTYASMKEKTSPRDTLPELYYLSVLAGNQQYAEFKKVLETLLVKSPDNPTLQEWKTWVEQQLE